MCSDRRLGLCYDGPRLARRTKIRKGFISQSESALTAMLTVIGIHTSGDTPRGESSKLLKENVLTRSQVDKAFEKWKQL